MFPEPGSLRNLHDPRAFPASSSRFQAGLHRIPPEKLTEGGSSIPAGIPRIWNLSNPARSLVRHRTGSCRNVPGNTIRSFRKRYRKSPQPTGIIRFQTSDIHPNPIFRNTLTTPWIIVITKTSKKHPRWFFHQIPEIIRKNPKNILKASKETYHKEPNKHLYLYPWPLQNKTVSMSSTDLNPV